MLYTKMNNGNIPHKIHTSPPILNAKSRAMMFFFQITGHWMILVPGYQKYPPVGR